MNEYDTPPITSKGINPDAKILRKIVGVDTFSSGTREVDVHLECGHVRRTSQFVLGTEQPERGKAFCPECEEILRKADFGGDITPEMLGEVGKNRP